MPGLKGLAPVPSGSRRRVVVGGATAALTAAWSGATRAVSAPPASPKRIVSVGGALTETLYALGAQDELVGVDTTSLYPDVARKLPSVGYARALSAEGVLSLAPTLLVATEEAGPPAVLRQLQAARLDLQMLDSGHSIEGVVARTRRLAELTGRTAAGQALLGRLQGDWQRAQARVASLKAQAAAQGRSPAQGPRVMFLMGPSLNQLRAAGRNTGADALMAYAGARNAFGEVDGYKPLTPEAAIAAAPDVIIATDMAVAAVGGAAQLLTGPGLAQTPAGKAGRVVTVEILLALGFGPRLPLATTTLAEALYAPR